ncbi:hypothetical protein [Streptomyces chiangmaiensis]|uniref:C2H2-type domain-containing protein n=1 Tax=Streptomyces chiangmaiensis TaxID=766497 RepID=A0ABU7FJZ9_9ACTN|nr:hypothetical protein [Streptomyces chiangmaiensis]MED7823683.1 hypothetical protein [Streptomyces chiangmaiensis]
MSEIAGRTGRIAAAGLDTGQAVDRGVATAVVQESYSFACMRCGHGWEQSYDIEHHLDGDGNEFVIYVAGGRVVPSPLSRPSCLNCDSHVVRIMRPGQVSSVQNSMHGHHRPVGRAAEETLDEPVARAEKAGQQHHWHLSDLLHVFHHRKAG